MRHQSIVVDLLLIGAVCGFLFFYGLGSFGLMGTDEPRYAQIAGEMLQRRDVVTPVLNGEPWMEKPPLYYWGAMACYALFGFKDWAARIPAATFALLLVVFVYFFIRRFHPGRERSAALILASSAGIVGFSRGASTDMMLAAPFAAAMLSWWGWFREKKAGWLYAFYIFLAIGTLAKGPVAPFLAALIVFVFACGVLSWDWMVALRTLSLGGLGTFLVISLPWYIAVQIRNPTFFRTFILEHNLARFGTNLYQHQRPFWFYLPVLALSLVPWIVPAVAALGDAIGLFFLTRRKDKIPESHTLTDRTREEQAPDDQTGDDQSEKLFQIYLAVWSLLPVIFFSISKSKLPGYILPSLPAFSLLTAVYLGRARPSRVFWAAHAMVVSLLTGLAWLLPGLLLRQKGALQTEAPKAAVAAAVCFVLTYLLLRFKNGRLLPWVTLAGVGLFAGMLLMPAAKLVDETYSARPIAERLQFLASGQNINQVAVLEAKREVEYGLNYYRGEKISRYERGEVPQLEHILVVREGFEQEMQSLLGDRRRARIGEFPAQKLIFYRVEEIKAQNP